MTKFAKEGYPFILFFAALTVIVYAVAGGGTASIPFILFLFMLYFFRDPERTVPQGTGIFVSPADGKVILVQETREEQYIEDEAMQVSIFMSPLDVHVNRAPCEGKVEKVVHTPGKFLSAYKPEASLQNENIAMLLATPFGRVMVRQVAGFIARRAVCRVKPGDTLKTGERYGVIKFSSRADLFLPKGTVIRVKEGDRVLAGETVIGVRGNQGG
ncbi:MAG: phosphatidylserine decarboxylase family protein [Nitrospirales bacterium]|nr:phosphatidylserine decarboxylase family protein [Nitrospirales bacterium]